MQGFREQTNFGEFTYPDPSRDWVAIGLRVIPAVLVLITGWLLRPTPDGDENAAAIQTDARAAGVDGVGSQTAEAGAGGPTLTYDRRPPQLFVQGTIGAPDELSASGPSSTTGARNATDGSPTDAGPATSTSTSTSISSGAAAAYGSSSSRPTTTRATSTPPTTPRSTTRVTTPRTAAGPTTAGPTTITRPTTAPPSTAGGNCSGGGEFERIFRDDFSGSSLGGNWSQFNSQGNSNYGLRVPSANTVANGRLIITAQMRNGTLESGGMSHAIDQRYGKYVVRVRTDNDPSQAVSGVVLTWPQSGVHPRDGENNIYETLVKTPNRNPFFTFIHKPYGSKSDQEHYKHTADGAQFQLMTMEWTPDRITIIREGPGGATYRDVWTVNETSADLIPDVAHHLSIQLDAWKHSIAGPVRMEVDYVEIYKYCG